MTSAEIKKAMVNFSPVKSGGIEYEKINAYIYRIFVNPQTRIAKEVFQVELQDKSGNSITIANANDVELVEKTEVTN